MEMNLSMHTAGRGHALLKRTVHPGIDAQALHLGSFGGVAHRRAEDASSVFSANHPSAGSEHGERETVLHFLQGLITAIAVILLLASLSKAHGESYSFRNYQQSEGLQNPNISNLL